MICPNCKATKLVGAGWDRQEHGKVHRYKCKRCSKTRNQPETYVSYEDTKNNTGVKDVQTV